MPTLTVQEAYDVLRVLSDQHREAERLARDALARRDALIVCLDGQDGVFRAGLAAAAGISAGRISYMLRGSDDRPESHAVPAQLRDAIEAIRPDLGRVRKITTRA